MTPDGQSLTVSTVEATVAQYGGYVTISDMLQLTAIDNNMVQAVSYTHLRHILAYQSQAG